MDPLSGVDVLLTGTALFLEPVLPVIMLSSSGIPAVGSFDAAELAVAILR
jgi:hypothetical protein